MKIRKFGEVQESSIKEAGGNKKVYKWGFVNG